MPSLFLGYINSSKLVKTKQNGPHPQDWPQEVNIICNTFCAQSFFYVIFFIVFSVAREFP